MRPKAPPPHLTLRGLRKVYGDAVAVAGLDLAVARGEFLVILGPSGCGKTTILRLIAGLTEPTAGEVEIDGRSINRLPPGRRGVAMVFQSFALQPHLTVAGNLSFELPGLRLGRDAAGARVRETARSLSIEELLDRYPSELSSGQQQRVALGRALARAPEILLLDEPLSSLDAGLRESVRAEILRLHRLHRSTTILVTHDPADALALATRIAVLRAGRLEQAGAPPEIYRSPRTSFVAGFLGSPPMNLVAAAIHAPGGRAYLALAGARIELPDGGAPPGPAGEVIAGLRPEAIRIVPPGSGRIHGEVERVTNRGRESVIHIILRGAGREAVLRALSGPDPGVEAGSAVEIDFDPRALHFFDALTGAACAPFPPGAAGGTA